MIRLTALRLLVVGASSGIGRRLAVAAAAAGASVALAARRKELLRAAVVEAGPAAMAIFCDVRRPADCQRVVDEAVAALGGLDAVVYAAGVSPLARVIDAGPEVWQAVVETNLVGPALVAAAAIPHLLASRGRLVLLGSSSVGRPFPGLVPYAATKAAVHELARGLRSEHPDLRVTTVVVGPTATDFASGWDPALMAILFERWAAEGYLAGPAALPVQDMARQILYVLGCGVRIDEIHVMPDGGTSPVPV
ncbi:MAG: SDR family oxidoreductase [Acidimicrobiales bacterium]